MANKLIYFILVQRIQIMTHIVYTFRLFLVFIGLMLCYSCSNENPSGETAPISIEDTSSINVVKVNQKPDDESTESIGEANIIAAIDRFVDDNDLRYAGISINVTDTKDGKVLGSYNPRMSLVPASSMKVVTTAAALKALGDDFTFKTFLEYDGELIDGTLKGNIYITGQSDPTLGTHQNEVNTKSNYTMNTFASVITKKGIQKIEGAVVGDASYLPSQVNCPTWQWDDLGNYYAGGIWGLNYHENLYFLEFQQTSKLGGQPKINKIYPAVPNLVVENEVVSAKAGSGDNAYIFGAPYNYNRFVRGTIPVGSNPFTIKGSIPEPAAFAAHYLEKALEKKDIKITQPSTTQRQLKSNKTRTNIIINESEPLLEIAKLTNYKSVNLYAEALLRVMNKEAGGDGSLEKAIETLYDFWEAEGLAKDGLFIADASGLSSKNGVSAYHFTKMMEIISKDKAWYDSFLQTLPTAGKSGTLQRMLKGTIAEGKIQAKSGTHSNARSYTGYATNRAGNRLAFSIIVNNFSCGLGDMRKKMEKLMVAFCE